MARSGGLRSANGGARKKMVQPVLPALPLLPKLKNEPVKDQKEEKIVVNGAKPRKAAELQTDHPRVTTTSEEEGNDKGEDNDESQPNSLIDLSVVTDTPDLLSEPIDLGTLATLIPAELPEDSQDQSNGYPNQEAAQPTNHNEEVLEVEQLPSDEQQVKPHEHQDNVTTAGDKGYFATSELGSLNKEKEEHKSFDAGTAPEPVTGNVETTSTSHSAKPSESNSSIQKTPQHAFAIPTSPTSTASASGIALPNRGGLASPAPVSNGSSTSTGRPGVPNGANLSPTVQPTFPTIFSHIHALQYTNDWFDCEVCVYFPQSSKPAIYRNAHSLILIRSERLRNFIYPQRANSYSYYVINLAPARSVDPHAFDAALRFLYNDTILSADRLIPQSVMLDKAGKVAAFSYSISYMVAGLELGLEPVTTRALDLIGRLLDWDTAEMAVKESSLLRSSSITAANPHAPSDAIFAAKSILQHVFNLIVLSLNSKEFKLDASSTPADLTSRFTQFEANKAVNPALANMVFGSMPVSANTPATSPIVSPTSDNVSEDTVASNIMLNLEFEDFRELAKGIKKVHGEDGVRVIVGIVEERERRRFNIFNNRSFSNAQRLANPNTWDIIGWREYVSDGALRRERLGFLQPGKRGGKH